MVSDRARVIVALAAAALLTATAPGATVAAQQDDANATGTPVEIDADDEYSAELDQYTTITDWSYDAANEEFTVTFESEEPVTVTAIDSRGESEEGIRRYAVTQERLSRGTNTITAPATPVKNEAEISLTTPHSLDNGVGVEISTGIPAENPMSNVGPITAWVAGAVIAVSSFSFGWWRQLRKSHDAPKRAKP